MYEAIVTVNGQELRSGQFPNEQSARHFIEGLTALGVTPQDQRIVPVQELWSKADAAATKRETAASGGGMGRGT